MGVCAAAERQCVVATDHAVPLGEVAADERIVGDVRLVHRSDSLGGGEEQRLGTGFGIPLQREIRDYLGEGAIDSQHRAGHGVVGRSHVGVGEGIGDGAVEEPPQPGDDPVKAIRCPGLVPIGHEQGIDVSEVHRVGSDRGDVVVEDLEEVHGILEIGGRFEFEELRIRYAGPPSSRGGDNGAGTAPGLRSGRSRDRFPSPHRPRWRASGREAHPRRAGPVAAGAGGR